MMDSVMFQMGLDQYLYFQKHEEFIKGEEWYFRKNWELQEWIEERFGCGNGCIYQTMTLEDIEDLYDEWKRKKNGQDVLDCCQTILENPDWFLGTSLIYSSNY